MCSNCCVFVVCGLKRVLYKIEMYMFVFKFIVKCYNCDNLFVWYLMIIRDV